jgi:hypothetical protein
MFAMLKYYKIVKSKDEIGLIFKRFDKDRDNKISFDEVGFVYKFSLCMRLLRELYLIKLIFNSYLIIFHFY